MVDLAELLVERIDHAEWAIFAKNGTDATTVSLTVARADTGRNRIEEARLTLRRSSRRRSTTRRL